YRSLAQEGESIEDFYSKLLKYGKMLNLDEQQIKEKFLRGLSSDLKDDVERIDILDSIAPVDWIEKLKAKIGTNMLAYVESLFTSALSIQKSNF
ncbi:28183_t:CDS:2, partial [Racocetra persica]